tara:strand:+ start:491 stop:778 length:288 start_codon:yes stop_codon:yes gene_type:complete
MVKDSVDFIQEAAKKELAHLKTARNLRIFLGITPEPGYLRIPYDIMLTIDRILFGKDSSYRRRMFGLNPWLLKPFYRCYDRKYSKWVAKQPLHWS